MLHIVQGTEHTAGDLIHPKRQRFASWVPEDVGNRGWALQNPQSRQSSEDPRPFFPGGSWRGGGDPSVIFLPSCESWSRNPHAAADISWLQVGACSCPSRPPQLPLPLLRDPVVSYLRPELECRVLRRPSLRRCVSAHLPGFHSQPSPKHPSGSPGRTRVLSFVMSSQALPPGQGVFIHTDTLVSTSRAGQALPWAMRRTIMRSSQGGSQTHSVVARPSSVF